MSDSQALEAIIAQFGDAITPAAATQLRNLASFSAEAAFIPCVPLVSLLSAHSL